MEVPISYAYWRKCDFQVHTPRDPNWIGDRPIGLGDKLGDSDAIATVEDVDAAREVWADQFVDQCLAKGLEVVAITDHHEMVMVSYVEKAVVKRRKIDPNFDLWVFPGMELTASGGKQCLILFDSDLSDDWRRQAQGKLGIAFANLDEKATKSPKVTQLFVNYADIAKELDTLPGLQGRYIVLPNVSQGNSHTVLVDGAYADFRRMPYVGGYLDRGQTIETLGPKNRKRLSGTDVNWSAREIYPLPTSDARSATYENLGENNTWIKLAEPTAEAVRQAFLGYRSRIRIAPPQIPSLTVSSIEIEGSSILQGTTIPLSPELNSTIGGRGSGKSSLLEYLSFALGRSCFDLPRHHYSGTARLSELINDTFLSKGGRVSLKITQDNAQFSVERNQVNAYQPQITYPNGETQKVTTKELRGLFPAVVYSQGELAEIGKQAGMRTQLTDVLQFVNPEYKREDDQLISDIEAAKDAVNKALQKLVSYWSLQARLRQLNTNRASLNQRALALEKMLPKQSDEDQATIEYFEKAAAFESKRLQASKHADQILRELDSVANEHVTERDLKADISGVPAMIADVYGDFYRTFRIEMTGLRDGLKAKRGAMADAESEWAEIFTKSRDARDAALAKLSEHKNVTTQIIKLREEIAELTNQIGDLEARLQASGDPAKSLQEVISALKDKNALRATRTKEWASELETLSDGRIRATVSLDGDVSEIAEALELVATKTGSQDASRARGLAMALSVSSAEEVVDRLRADCLALLYWRQIGAAAGQEQPKCDELMRILGDTERIRAALHERIDTARVEAIGTAVAKPEIKLSYCDGDRQISFEKASEGQRAAALLLMLLEQPGGPLIIDQPEGDLDNKVIADLTEKLHSAKPKRQLIFASHNANIVVNGSSELVAHMDIDESGKRKVACVGAIDKREVCEVITAIMEGGEKAFKDRQEKYGY